MCEHTKAKKHVCRHTEVIFVRQHAETECLCVGTRKRNIRASARGNGIPVLKHAVLNMVYAPAYASGMNLHA